MMSCAKTTAIILLSVISFVPLTASADEYVVSIDFENPRLAQIKATIEPDGIEIGMNDDGDQGLEHGWATFIENIKVTSTEGVTYPLVAKKNSKWDIIGYQSGSIKLSYNVVLGHDQVPLNFGDNGAAYSNDSGVMWAGRALFIAGKPARDISIRFELPENWIISTPWEQKPGSANTFEVLETQDLLNSAFFAGTHEQFDLSAGEVTLRLALAGPNTLSMREQISHSTGQYLDYYEAVFRSTTRASMLMIASDSSYWGGEVMGRAISLSIGGEAPPGFNPLSVLSHVIAHEIFHVFIGVRMEIDQESGSFDWFNEGFGAEYATWLARVRLGEVSEDEFLAELVNQANTYQAKVDGQLNLVLAGQDKASNYDMVYSGGFIAAMALDFLIRNDSDGGQSLDDLWTVLLQKYPRGGTSLTLPGLLNTVGELYGQSISSALEAYINSPETIPFFRNAQLMGLSYEDGKLFPSENATESQQAMWRKTLSG